MERQTLIASDGMVLTDGEIYGREIYLAEGVNADAFHEITEAEYEQIVNSEEATADDYLAALERLGVE